MKKFVSFTGSTGLPDVMEYAIGDEPTFTVHGRVIDVSEREKWDDTVERRFTFDVKAADIDQGDGVTLMLPVSDPVPVPARSIRRARARVVAALVWPTAGYLVGYVIAIATR